MRFEDRFVVRAPIGKVWAFLRNPTEVAQCVPGTEKVEVIDGQHYHVIAGAKVSFLSVTFALKVTLTDIQEPQRLVAEAEGIDTRIKDRVKVRSEMDLREVSSQETEISYKTDVVVFGKLAAIGFSVIQGKARQMAAEFTRSVRSRLEAHP